MWNFLKKLSDAFKPGVDNTEEGLPYPINAPFLPAMPLADFPEIQSSMPTLDVNIINDNK